MTYNRDASEENLLEGEHMRIKELRKQNGFTQEKLALSLGVDRSTITCWETGRSEPRIAYLIMLADMFHCTVDDLLREEKTKK